MVMSWIWLALILVATICAAITGRGNELAAATVDGAQKAVTLALSMTGSLCLWSGVGELMEAVGITSMLSKLLRPLLHRIFPGSKSDPRLANTLSGNICANILGLGNAGSKANGQQNFTGCRHQRTVPTGGTEHSIHSAHSGKCSSNPTIQRLPDTL